MASAVHRHAEEDKPKLDPVGLYRRIPLLPHQMSDAVTSAEHFFVLVHLGVPQIEAQRWRLTIGGLVERPLQLGLADLKALPQRSIQSVFQCAGNPLEPTQPTRRVANVVWSGVPLSAVLRAVGAKPKARYLWSFGLDYGSFAGKHCEAYGKDLPLDRVALDEVLIATALDGEPLSAEHGFPARLVVPGYYGTNSVKWLARLEFSDRRLDALFTTTFYDDAVPGEPPRPVWGIPVESMIVSPAPGATIEAGCEIEIKGWAWAESGVAGVEISADGVLWHAAAVEPRQERSWQGFSTCWRPSEGGPCRLMVRALSNKGDIQPMAGARNAVHVVDVMVRDAATDKELKPEGLQP